MFGCLLLVSTVCLFYGGFWILFCLLFLLRGLVIGVVYVGVYFWFGC